ncbi:hypothetical protein OF001_U360015 [Pseudomonas sp. OF001]|nr:hypothetical protein OF001_U360015 [Pseudomonas sp. OF001]
MGFKYGDWVMRIDLVVKFGMLTN